MLKIKYGPSSGVPNSPYFGEHQLFHFSRKMGHSSYSNWAICKMGHCKMGQVGRWANVRWAKLEDGPM